MGVLEKLWIFLSAKEWESWISAVVAFFLSSIGIQISVNRSARPPSVLLSDCTPTRQLWSSDSQLLSQPADNTVFASRASSSTAPHTWNGLPLTFQTAPSVNTFWQRLKTRRFFTKTA